MSKFRILSIDGGGVRGIIPARILQYFEEVTHKKIHEHFDLIIGTSTGGIIALGLINPVSRFYIPPYAALPSYSFGNDKSPVVSPPTITDSHRMYHAKDIVWIYRKYSNKIFNKSKSRKLITGFGMWGSKYDRKGYDSVMEDIFGNCRLSTAVCPVIVPTYSLEYNKPNLFSSYVLKPIMSQALKMSFCHSRINIAAEVISGNKDTDPYDYYIRDIASACGSAPTYFLPKEFQDIGGNWYKEIDAGVFANNPESIAVTEAFRMKLELKREDIQIISIGTGSFPNHRFSIGTGGVFNWLLENNLIDLMINATSYWDTEEISDLYKNSYRIQVPLDRFSEMDDASDKNINFLLESTEEYIGSNEQLLNKLLKDFLFNGKEDN